MKRRTLLIIFLLILLTSCAPSQLPSPSSQWRYAHLLTLDPADAAHPALDLIALYTRSTAYDLQIRLDILDLLESSHADFYIALDLAPGGEVKLPINAETSRLWDILIIIPAESPARISNLLPPNSKFQNPIPNSHSPPLPIPRVIRDPVLDTLTISLNAHLLPEQAEPFYIQAFATSSGSPEVLDSIAPTSSEAVTHERAPMLISFWNALPAHTPAQALRRWDGAHTGPLGRRHGLKYLIEAAGRHQVPIALLDLKSPLSLSALEFLGGLSQIEDYAKNNLITIPDTLPAPLFGDLPAWANQRGAAIGREKAIKFGLKGSSLLYTHAQQPTQFSPYRLSLVLQPAVDEGVPQTHIFRSGDRSILPIPLKGYDTVQISEDGINLDIKKALLTAAIEADSSNVTPITVLGGDLPHTNWGDPLIVDLTMRYISAHPWIQPLAEADILTFPQQTGYVHLPLSGAFQQHDRVLEALESAPTNTITNLAWDAYLTTLAPADPDYQDLPKLRSQYLGVIGDLLSAAQWENNIEGDEMAIRKDCAVDSDFDGQPECMLSSENMFALIDPQGARLSLFFIRDENGPIQVVGQSSQFAVGLSDPFTWDYSRVPLSDPKVIPGAFAGPWELYEITYLPDGLRFSSPSVQKDYILSENGLHVEYQISKPIQVQVPLALAPETRFSSGWEERYYYEDSPQGWIWGIDSGPRVIVDTSGVLTTQTFIDDLPALSFPEDPNYDYPPGHFLPIPLGVATIQAEEDFWVELFFP